VVVWCISSALVSIEVNLCRAQLVLGRVTESEFNSRCGRTFILVCNQPLRPSPYVGRRNEYQPKGGDVAAGE